MTTIAITNRKGGVGKSSHALHIATGLATVGYRVGLIDTDSQGHIAFSLGMEPTDALYEVLVDAAPLDAKHFIPIAPDRYSTADYPAKGELYILSSADRSYLIPHHIGDNTFALLNLIDRMKREYQLHFVIVDTSPTLKDIDALVWLATDAFVYVTELEALALQGLDKAVEQMLVIAEDRRRHLKRPTAVLGIIPNKKRDTIAHDVGLEELQAKYGDKVWTPVKLNTIWTEASHERQVLYTYAPTSKAATEAWSVTSKVAEAVKSWLSV